MRVAIENLEFSYSRSKPVLRNISLDIPPGRLTALIGPNAAGKSTLLKCIAGIEKAHGNILFHSRNSGSVKSRDLYRHISYLPQDTSFKAQISVFEAVLLGLLKNLTLRVGDDELEKVMKVLKLLNIDHLATRYINELSGGQKQLVSIAQALVNSPEVLLLDEPTSSLDLRNELRIIEQISAVTKDKGITTLVAIHSLSLASRYADNVVVLKDGTVYTSGEPDTVV